MANRAAGKGYENEDYYTNIKLQFIGIENIHVMRNSQQKIIDGEQRRVRARARATCCLISFRISTTIWKRLHLSPLPPSSPAVGELRSPSMSDFLWGLENSGWLKHIKAILDAGVFISRVR